MARAISLVEDEHPAVRELLSGLTDRPGAALVVGLTGAPGVGKSTTTNALVRALRAEGRVVGVLAVDPSSPFSGGALLGDRIRMEEHATDPGVFLRSMASRGHLGGLAAATAQAVRVLEAAGCDLVLVETVGVGQSEVEVVALADTTVVLLAPGLGDGIQAAKAGILEIGDVFIVNKADREGADATVRDLRHMIQMADRTEPGQWRPRVVRASALDGTGIAELVEAIGDHHDWLTLTGSLVERRRARIEAEVLALALERVRGRLSAEPEALARQVGDVVTGRSDTYAAAEALLGALTVPPSRARGADPCCPDGTDPLHEDRWLHKPTLTGDRVILRPLGAADAEAMAAVLDDPELLRLTGSVTSTAEAEAGFTPDEAFHDWYATRPEQPDRLDLAIVERATGDLVGEIVLNERDASARACNLRILVGAAGRGRGLGTEAVRLLTAYGLDVLELHRISLEVHAFNARARHVYEKVGFVHEGTLRQALSFDGDWVDTHVMAILAGDPRG